MAKASDPPAGATADKAGLLSGFLAEENEFDRRTLWRIASWGVAAVGAVVLAVAANQSSMGWRRDQVAAADLSRQAQQIASLAKESQNETTRLASAIDTLNNDRDRLFARVTVVEQGLDSVTGAINKQSAAANSAVSASPPKPMPPASAMPSMISAPPVVAADNAASTTPAPQSQVAAPVANTAAVSPEKPKEQIKGQIKEQAKAEPAKVEQPKAEQAKTEQAKTDTKADTKADTAKPAPAAADTASLPQIASNKPTAAVPVTNPPAAAPVVAAQTPPSSMGATKSMMGPPDPGAPRMIEMSKETTKETTKTANAAPAPVTATPAPALDANAAAAPPKDEEKPELEADAGKDAENSTIQRTEFAVELGGANSIGGLRALWRGLLKTHSNRAALAELQPIIVLRESNTGLGMQLKLAAGPLHDAAEAARICAALTESGKRTCETTVFDGQRLAMGNEEAQPVTEGKQPPTPAGDNKPTSYKHHYSRHSSKKEEPPPPPPPQQSSTFSSLFGIKH